MTASPYRIYGELEGRDAIALAGALLAKGLPVERIRQNPSLSMVLAARAGRESGPYLRTPEGFVLGGLHAMLEWLERAHPDPPLIPESPVRRVCARLLEDWIELWLPLWPRRSWETLELLGAHLAAARFCLGPSPTRPDWLLAAWLESEVLPVPHARSHLGERAPRLARLASDLLETPPAGGDADDALPISLLAGLEEIARDYHAYLRANRTALGEGTTRVEMDLGEGRRTLPVRPVCESRRAEIAELLRSLPRRTRLDVRRVLEPVGAWPILTLPGLVEPNDPADPRSL